MTKFLDLFGVFSYICSSNCTRDCSLLWQDLFLIEMFIEANKMRFCAIIDRLLICLCAPEEFKPPYCSEDRCLQQAERVTEEATLLLCRLGFSVLLSVSFLPSCHFLKYLRI